MIPITLVTGFLGSGKTTFLQRVVERHRDRRLVYLVNEFSSVDVDGRVLACDEGDVVAVSGGSIFCRCLVTEFIGQLKAIAQRATGDGKPLEGVVIEASGIADPRVIGQLLEETRLDREYRLAGVVSIVDPGSFLKLIHTLPNIRAQVEASTLALLNKTDLYAAEQVDAAESALREINPSLTIVRTEHCRADVDLFAGGGVGELRGVYALCADPNYASASLTLDCDMDLDWLLDEFRAAADDIYRVKGFVRTGGAFVHVDVSPAGIKTQAANSPVARGELTFIVPGSGRTKLDALLGRIRSHACGGDAHESVQSLVE